MEPHPALPESQHTSAAQSIVRAISVVALLYIFLVAIQLMSGGFKLMGKDFAESLVQATNSPIVGLFIGILATAVIQSSSVTTSMVVGLVSAGGLSIESAVPIIMGANIGTSVTNTIVSLAHMTRRDEFRRAFSGAVVHDVFNWLSVAVLLPLELATGFLRHSASWVASQLFGASTGLSYTSPIKAVVKPVAKAIGHFATDTLGFANHAAGITLLILALALIFVALSFLVKVLKAAMSQRLERAVNRALSKGPFVTIGIGIAVTALVQSSSITTSILIPLVSTGLLRLEHAYPITLGANVGTTVTALLASLAGNVHGLAIALVHLFFNISGILLFYPVPFLRRLPIRVARALGGVVAKRRMVAIALVVTVFFLVPFLVILLSGITSSGS